MVPRTVPWNIDIWNIIFYYSMYCVTFVFDKMLPIILNFKHLRNNVKSNTIWSSILDDINLHWNIIHWIVNLWNYWILKFNYPKLLDVLIKFLNFSESTNNLNNSCEETWIRKLTLWRKLKLWRNFGSYTRRKYHSIWTKIQCVRKRQSYLYVLEYLDFCYLWSVA